MIRGSLIRGSAARTSRIADYILYTDNEGLNLEAASTHHALLGSRRGALGRGLFSKTMRQHAICKTSLLSPELIEQIALCLRARDISSLSLSCKRFHDIVRGSLLLKYTYRTDLAGLYDSLRDISRRSIVDRI